MDGVCENVARGEIIRMWDSETGLECCRAGGCPIAANFQLPDAA